MNYSPKQKREKLFNQSLSGFFGEFSTDKSNSLAYLQTVIKSVDLPNLLNIASETFTESNFEELIQRDLEQSRVIAIADGYLNKGYDRALFFPPLIAALLPVEGNKLLTQFESREDIILLDDEMVVSTWGKNRFRLNLVLAEQEGHNTFPYEVTENDNTKSTQQTYNHWATLEFNDKKVAIVVIDGQHRLAALKHLSHRNPEAVKNLNVPVCIVFAPDAHPKGQVNQDVSLDARELFVRINNEGKKVSGHFIILLSDKKLSSLAVREFCQIAKDTRLKVKKSDPSLLHLIEWNIREDRRSNQLNTKYSITSIGIIADILSKFAYEKHSYTMLNLKSEQLALEEGLDIGIDAIAEGLFHSSQTSILKNLAHGNTSEPLVSLFTKPRPYSNRIAAFEKAFNDLDTKVESSERGSGSEVFRDLLLTQFRETDRRKESLDLPNTVAADVAFQDAVQIYEEEKSGPDDNIYFLKVFQQAYIRVWITLSLEFSNYDLTPEDAAKVMLNTLSSVVFSEKTSLFGRDRSYNKLTLYKNGGSPNVNQKGFRGWKDLLFASFLEPSAKVALTKAVKKVAKKGASELLDKINSDAQNSLERLQSLISETHISYVEKNWRDLEDEIGDASYQTLRKLEANWEDTDAENEQWESEINKIAKQKRIKPALKSLNKILALS